MLTDYHRQITDFVDRLSQVQTAADVYNQYGYGNPYNDIRRANFTRYLNQMAAFVPETILVMEAPGYRGSRLTGVPVTSRKILLNGIDGLGLFGVSRGYENVAEPGFERINGEQSATAVWPTLAALGKVALVWNAFPFHPRKEGLPLTNRTPRRSETEIGLTFLREMIDLFKCKQIIAVGNIAHDSLNRLGVEHLKVRHPAQGGKNDFMRGLHEAMR